MTLSKRDIKKFFSDNNICDIYVVSQIRYKHYLSIKKKPFQDCCTAQTDHYSSYQSSQGPSRCTSQDPSYCTSRDPSNRTSNNPSRCTSQGPSYCTSQDPSHWTSGDPSRCTSQEPSNYPSTCTGQEPYYDTEHCHDYHEREQNHYYQQYQAQPHTQEQNLSILYQRLLKMK